jgi:hypothetical protein
MKTTDLKLELSKISRGKILKEIASKLGIEKYKLEHYKDEFSTINVPFESSMEGLIIAIENNNLLLAYPGNKSLVDISVLKSGWHFYINPWVYENMPKKALNKMKATIKKALKLLPDAVLIFDDDSSMDYNVNSAIPEHEKNYTCKVSNPNEWLEKFNFE